MVGVKGRGKEGQKTTTTKKVENRMKMMNQMEKKIEMMMLKK